MSVVQNEAVAVIIPAPNEAEALRLWKPKLAASSFQSSMVVNHGRSDETAEVARTLEAQVVNEAQKGGMVRHADVACGRRCNWRLANLLSFGG